MYRKQNVTNVYVFSLQDKLYGLSSNNYALNCILIVMRQMVYTCKIKKKNCSTIDNIRICIIIFFSNEKYIANSNRRNDKFTRKWFQLRNLCT